MKLRVRQARTSAGPAAVEKSFVGFEVGGVRYAIDIHRVREIIRPMTALELPHVPEMVTGVVDHRGDVVPVLDLRVRFGIGASRYGGAAEGHPSVDRDDRDERAEGLGHVDQREVRWVIVTRGDRLVALVVDRVSEVFGTSTSDGREVPEIGVGEASRGIAAAYSHRGGLVFVLEADTLTSVTEELVLPRRADMGGHDAVG